MPLNGGRAVSASRSGFAPLRSDSSSGSSSGQDRPRLSGLVARQPEHAEVELVVGDHVDEVAAANDAGSRAHVGVASLGRRLGQVELAQLGQLERRQVLGL